MRQLKDCIKIFNPADGMSDLAWEVEQLQANNCMVDEIGNVSYLVDREDNSVRDMWLVAEIYYRKPVKPNG
jgi:hypothetical protein